VTPFSRFFQLQATLRLNVQHAIIAQAQMGAPRARHHSSSDDLLTLVLLFLLLMTVGYFVSRFRSPRQSDKELVQRFEVNGRRALLAGIGIVGSRRRAFVTYVFLMDDPRWIKWLAIACLSVISQSKI